MRLVLPVLLFVALAAGQDRAPNVLLIISDDVTYNDLPLYGGANIETPNLDRLASEGLVFDQAYLAMAMCNPCRTELYTGLYPFRNGSAWNHSAARPGTRSVVHHLGELGYRVGLSGKKHVEPAESFPFEDVPGVPNPREKTPQPDFDTAKIEQFMKRDPGQPFFLVTAFHEAHAPWTVGRPDLIDKDELVLPRNFADTPETRRHYTDYLAEIVVLDWEIGRLLDALEASGQADDTIVIFTSEQGSAYPGNKWTNWNTGVHTALVVRWPGVIGPGRRTSALVQYADVVPTLVAIAGGEADERFDGGSFLPVLRGEATRHRDYAYFLHNNVPEGPPYPIRAITDGEWRYIQNLHPDRLFFEKHMMGGFRADHYWPSWLRVTGPWGDEPIHERAVDLLNRFLSRPAEQLYHTAEDPFEMRDRMGDLDLRDVRDRLAAELGRWMHEQGDPGAALDTEEQWRAAVQGAPLTRLPD